MDVDSENEPLIVQTGLKSLGVEAVCGIQPLYPVVVEDDGTVLLIALISAQDGLIELISGIVVLNGRVDGGH